MANSNSSTSDGTNDLSPAEQAWIRRALADAPAGQRTQLGVSLIGKMNALVNPAYFSGDPDAEKPAKIAKVANALQDVEQIAKSDSNDVSEQVLKNANALSPALEREYLALVSPGGFAEREMRLREAGFPS